MTSKGPRTILVEGKSVQEAISKGLSILGVAKNKVTIEILSEETQGLFGMRGIKPAQVRMTLKR